MKMSDLKKGDKFKFVNDKLNGGINGTTVTFYSEGHDGVGDLIACTCSDNGGRMWVHENVKVILLEE